MFCAALKNIVAVILIFSQIMQFMCLKILKTHPPRYRASTSLFGDNSGYVSTVLMDLPKAYTCYPLHVFTIVKLEGYGLHKIIFHVLINHLSSRKQRTRIGSSFSNWWDVICGVDTRINLLFFASNKTNHSYFFVHSYLVLINFHAACGEYFVTFMKCFTCS